MIIHSLWGGRVDDGKFCHESTLIGRCRTSKINVVIKMKRPMLLAISMFIAFACGAEAEVSRPRKPLTVLISIDGFRPEYLERGLTPVLSALLKSGASAEPNMDCWRKAGIPSEFEFGSHRRIPEIFCLAQGGWSIVSNRSMKIIPGQHGYAPQSREMSAIFIASGPRINHSKIGIFKNVEVYGLLCELIGITPEPGTTKSDLPRVIVRK